jgi:hypothetical protein
MSTSPSASARTVSPKANLRFDRVTDEAGHDLPLTSRLHRARCGRSFRARIGARHEADGPILNIAAKPLGEGWLIVASNRPARSALDLYRKRWAIECLFGDAKTRGLNMEDTRLTCPRKLALLMAIVALALAWALCTATRILGTRAPEQGPRTLRQVLVPDRHRRAQTHVQNRAERPPNPLLRLQKSQSRVV